MNKKKCSGTILTMILVFFIITFAVTIGEFYRIHLLQQDIENLDIDSCTDAWTSWEEQEKEIREVFEGMPGHTARGLKEAHDKYVSKEELRRQLESLKRAWPTLKEDIRKQIIPFAQVKENLRLVGAPYEPEHIGVTRERLRKTFSYIPYMRSRFANIDIIYRCGLMSGLMEHLFGKGGIWEV